MESTPDPAAEFVNRPWMDPEAAPLGEEEPEKKSRRIEWGKPRNWRALTHAGPLAAWLLPAAGVNLLVPILIWQLKAKKDGDAVLTAQAIESLNFQLNVSALTVALSITFFGLVLVPVLWIAATVFMIIASMKAYRGDPYLYPWIYRVVKADVTN